VVKEQLTVERHCPPNTHLHTETVCILAGSHNSSNSSVETHNRALIQAYIVDVSGTAICNNGERQADTGEHYLERVVPLWVTGPPALAPVYAYPLRWGSKVVVAALRGKHRLGIHIQSLWSNILAWC